MWVKTTVNLESNLKEEVEKYNLETGNIHETCRIFSPWESTNFYTGKRGRNDLTLTESIIPLKSIGIERSTRSESLFILSLMKPGTLQHYY